MRRLLTWTGLGLIGLIIALSLLSACGSSGGAASPVPPEELVQTAASELLTSQAPTVTPTSTSTASPTPTETPIPYEIFTAQSGIEALSAAGLEVASPSLMEPSDYGLAPLVAIQGIHFFIPSLCADCGGRVFSFDDPEDLALHKDYYVRLGQNSALFFSWTFEHFNLLLQINGDLPRAQAEMYAEALNSLIP